MSGLPSSDGVPQYTDAIDLELDDISRPEPAVELEARAARRRARSDHLTGIERLVLRGVGDHVGEAVVHRAGGALTPHLAVHAHRHPRVRGVELVGGDKAG